MWKKLKTYNKAKSINNSLDKLNFCPTLQKHFTITMVIKTWVDWKNFGTVPQSKSLHLSEYRLILKFSSSFFFCQFKLKCGQEVVANRKWT